MNKLTIVAALAALGTSRLRRSRSWRRRTASGTTGGLPSADLVAAI